MVDMSEVYSTITDTFTMAFWAYPTATRPTTTEESSGVSGTEQSYAIFPSHGEGWYGTGHAAAGVSVGTNGISVFEHSSSYLPSLLVYDTTLSDWSFITVVYINKKPSLYLDGNLVRTSPFTSAYIIHPGRMWEGVMDILQARLMIFAILIMHSPHLRFLGYIIVA